VIDDPIDRPIVCEESDDSHQAALFPERSKEDQVTLSEFRRFILSFSEDRVDTHNKRRLVITKPFYDDAIKNPEKFQKALQKVPSVASSHFQDSFERA
jgi:hypothetical protein